MPLRENEAAAVVRSSVKEAFDAMYETTMQRMYAGEVIDARLLQSLSAELSNLSAQYGKRIVNEDLQDIFMDAAIEGATSTGVAGALSMLDEDAIAMAMANTEIHIKGVLDEGIKLINRSVTNSMITGKSLKEIAADLKSSLLIDGLEISQAHAEMIARNEVFSIYRQASKAVSNAAKVTKYKYTGPSDDVTSDICMEHIDQVRTEDEWLAIEPLIFIYGLHPNCRHWLDPVLLEK